MAGLTIRPPYTFYIKFVVYYNNNRESIDNSIIKTNKIEYIGSS